MSSNPDNGAIETLKLNEAKLTSLYEEYYDKIAHYVYTHIGDKNEAENIAGEVFLKALESLKSYRERGIPMQAWLFRIAHNLLVDHLMKVAKRKTIAKSIESLGLPICILCVSIFASFRYLLQIPICDDVSRNNRDECPCSTCFAPARLGNATFTGFQWHVVRAQLTLYFYPFHDLILTIPHRYFPSEQGRYYGHTCILKGNIFRWL